MQKRITQNQARGMLVGLAIGDAMGATLSGKQRGSFEPVSEFLGGGEHALAAGQWADSTAMAMCLGQTLRSANGWDPEDAMRRFVNWRDFGYMSSTGVCFGMGTQMADALARFSSDANPYAGARAEDQSGSAGIARIAPVILAYAAKVESAGAVAQLQSRLTHASALCEKIAHQLAEFLVTGDYIYLPQADEPPEEVTDYIMHIIQASYWAMRQGHSFREIVLAAINLGGASDRAGAVVGQLAGRVYGYEGIPAEWRMDLHDHDRILGIADDLYAMRPIDI